MESDEGEFFEGVYDSRNLSGDEDEVVQIADDDDNDTSQQTDTLQSPSPGDFTLSLLLDGKFFVLEAVSGKGICKLCKGPSSTSYTTSNNASNLTKHLASFSAKK